MVVFGQKWLSSGRVFDTGKSGCIWAKVVVFEKKWLYSGKVVVFVKKWLYSGKVVFFRQKWLYLGKSGCIEL